MSTEETIKITSYWLYLHYFLYKYVQHFIRKSVKKSYKSIPKNSSLHYYVYIFIIIREDVIQLYIIWKAVTNTRSWYRNIMGWHCSVRPYKRILSRPKTYETPYMSIAFTLRIKRENSIIVKKMCWVMYLTI